MKTFYRFLAWLMGKNIGGTPKAVIIDQMNETRPLPTGMTEFEEWTDRIISGTLLPADRESQQFALATMIMHLSPTTDHECDAYFIKSLRKGAINQIAHAKMEQIRTAAKARLKAQEEEAAIKAAQQLYLDTLATEAAQTANEQANENQANQASPEVVAAVQAGATNYTHKAFIPSPVGPPTGNRAQVADYSRGKPTEATATPPETVDAKVLRD